MARKNVLGINIPLQDLGAFSLTPPSKKERSLSEKEKKELKEKAKHRCQSCKKKFKDHILAIHHIKPISKYKGTRENPFDIEIFFQNKKKKTPTWDRKSNLIVLCHNCHADAHHSYEVFYKNFKEKRKEQLKKDKQNKKTTIKKSTKRKSNDVFSTGRIFGR